MMNTKLTLSLYAAITFLLFVDFSLLGESIEFAVSLFITFHPFVIGGSALLVLICVLLWKKPVQLSKDDILFFVAYHAVLPYGVFSLAMLIIMLFRILIGLTF